MLNWKIVGVRESVMTKTSPGAPRCRKPKHPRLQFTRKSVLKMLAVMSDETSDASEDFLTTGRVGRRNALANILSDHALTSTSDLPDKLNMCNLSDEDPDKPLETDVKEDETPNEPETSSES